MQNTHIIRQNAVLEMYLEMYVEMYVMYAEVWREKVLRIS